MSNAITLNELDQFQQSEDSRREKFLKQICIMEERVFARNISLVDQVSKANLEKITEEIPDLRKAKERQSRKEWARFNRYEKYLFSLDKETRERIVDPKVAKVNLLTEEMYYEQYGEKILAKETRSNNVALLNSITHTTRIYKMLLNYDVKRIKLFERAKKIVMGAAEWRHINQYLNIIEEQILTNLQFDDFYLLFNEIERLFGMIMGIVSNKLAHCMARPVKIIKNLIDSGKNLVKKVISTIKPEGKLENKPLTIDEWRKLEEAMALKHKNAVYLEKKLSDAKRIGEKNPSKIRNMIVDLMIKEKPNVLSS